MASGYYESMFSDDALVVINRNWLYQQNGKTFAIWQFNDRVPPPTRLRVFFGDGVAVSAALASGCACAVSSSPGSDEPLWASRKFELVLAPPVSDAELKRAGILKQLRHSGLIEVCEH